MTQKGINWNDLPIYQKRGSCCVRNKIIVSTDGVKETVQLRDLRYKKEIFHLQGKTYLS